MAKLYGGMPSPEALHGRISIGTIPNSTIDPETIRQIVEDELSTAKESGLFDGKDGYTPVKGIDYFDGEPGKDYVLTDADKTEIAEQAAQMVEVPDTYTKNEIDAIMGSYITDIDTLIGGDS